MRVLVVWPDGPRSVDPEIVIGWACDSWHNNAPAHLCLGCGHCTLSEAGECEHMFRTEPLYPDGSRRPSTIGPAIEWLSNTGEVTFAQRPLGDFDLAYDLAEARAAIERLNHLRDWSEIGLEEAVRIIASLRLYVAMLEAS